MVSKACPGLSVGFRELVCCFIVQGGALGMEKESDCVCVCGEVRLGQVWVDCL